MSSLIFTCALLTIVQNALVAAVAKVNKNVVVVINSVGAVNVEPWIGNANGTCGYGMSNFLHAEASLQ